MLVKRGGIFKTIDPKEFGIWQKAGFEKVINSKEVKEAKKEKRPEPELTIKEVHDTDKFVKLDEAKESITPPHSESEIEPKLDEDGCYAGVCEFKYEKPIKTSKRNKNK